MELTGVQEKLRAGVRKYRLVLLVVLIGILLMALPDPAQRQSPAASGEALPAAGNGDLQEYLTQLLSTMEGAGKVRILLTESAGQQIIYQTDRQQQETSSSEKTVCIRDTGRGEAGLIRQINPPTYQGAVVLCQGGGSASVRLSIVKAVSSATGLGADKITVLKMK